MISASMPYSQFLRPAPYFSSGRKRFQSPAAFAIRRMVTSDGGYGTPDRMRSISAAMVGSAGYT